MSAGPFLAFPNPALVLWVYQSAMVLWYCPGFPELSCAQADSWYWWQPSSHAMHNR